MRRASGGSFALDSESEVESELDDFDVNMDSMATTDASGGGESMSNDQTSFSACVASQSRDRAVALVAVKAPAGLEAKALIGAAAFPYFAAFAKVPLSLSVSRLSLLSLTHYVQEKRFL